MSTDEAIALPLTVNVIDGHMPAVPFPYRGGELDIVLPQWVYIKDRHGRYLTVREQSESGPEDFTLTFRTGQRNIPDVSCMFEASKVIGLTSWYKFIARNGNYVQHYYQTGWYGASSSDSKLPAFNVIPSAGNHVSIMNYYLPPKFLSDQLTAERCPMAHDDINESSQIEIHQAGQLEIFNVKYDIPGGRVCKAASLTVLSTCLVGDRDIEVIKTVPFTYKKWSVGTWNYTPGMEIGMKTTFEAGVPSVANAKFEISVGPSQSNKWGGEEGKIETVTSSIEVILPPGKKVQATIIVRNAEIEVGFTYLRRLLWADMRQNNTTDTGIYRNVDSWHVDVELDNWEDI